MAVLAYSGDAVYMYSTADDPEDILPSVTSLRTPNSKRRDLDEFNTSKSSFPRQGNSMDVDKPPSTSLNTDNDQDRDFEGGHDVDSEDYLEFADSSEVDEENFLPHIPVVLPRLRFAGARNVATIKDGGPNRSDCY